ncbi:MAG TPA: glycosyltransferase family 39 protein [Bryobacterales bacterium]|nr:glycosyltransferase family 39 protein [Bryobacterales bacterium]
MAANPAPSAAAEASSAPRCERRPSRLAPAAVAALVSAVLIGVSQTFACHPDEGFHLVAAHLINAGKKPYLDFFYQHAPLFAYLNAGWMRLAGESWRSAHLFSALLAIGSILLAANFVFDRLPDQAWRPAGAAAAALLAGLHLLVIEQCTVGLAYGLCLFLLVAAFCLAVEAVDRRSWAWPFGAGLAAGAAASASLLAAPAGVVLLAWLMRRKSNDGRLRRMLLFAAGGMIPFLPLLWLAALAPRQTLFDVIEYHLFYRPASPAAAVHDLKALIGLVDSSQGALLVLLACLGLLFVAGQKDWEPRRRAEFRLCAWLVGSIGAWAAAARPTFSSYFVLVVPFMAILAAIGVYAIGSRVATSLRPAWLVVPLAGIFALPTARVLVSHYRHPQFFWREIDAIAREVNRVTPKDGRVWSDEFVSFAARRSPPEGLENYNSQYLRVPPALAASLHVEPLDQLEAQLAAARFDTVVTCQSDAALAKLDWPRAYARRETAAGCYIFSDKVAR